MKRIAFSINHFLDKDKFSCLDINGFHLCEEDMNRLEQFLDILSQTAIPVYRGDKRVYKLYHEKDLYSLAKKIFVIGEKGDAFIDRALSDYCIINEKLFVRLFQDIKRALRSNSIGDFPDYPGNSSFVQFFSTKDKYALWEQVMDCTEQEQSEVSNYYISFLHTLGKYVLKKNSNRLSTSLDYRISREFSDKGIVFLAWIAQITPGYGDQIVDEENETIKRLKLPYWEKSIHPEQKEVCIKYGLLPQYIWGILSTKTNEIIVNPALFTSGSIKEHIDNGFDIDQRSFNYTLRDTEYKRFFYSVNNKYKWLAPVED